MRHDTLDSLMKRVLADHERKVDLLADTRHMSVEVAINDGTFTPNVELSVDEKDSDLTNLVMSEHALGQMATDLGIPKRYFDRMRTEAPELFKRNAHHWMYETPKRRMLRSYKETATTTLQGRAWLSDRYRRLDNIEIATRLLPEFGRMSDEAEFHNAYVTDERFYVRAVFPRMVQEVKVGDAVQWGVQIRNSEVGGASFAIESFMLQLVCKNGMVVAKVLNARHLGKRLDDVLSDEAVEADDHAFWLAARDTLRASMDETAFNEAVETLRGTTEGIKVQSIPNATKRLASTFSLSEEEHDAVLTRIAAGGDLSRWGVISAITNAAQSVENHDRSVELEELGWELATVPRKEWERIAVAA